MLFNHFKIAVRQLIRNRLFSLLNITGLTVGLAVSTFIALYIWHEFHYDRFQPFAERTYRVLSVSKFGGDDMYMTGMHESFGPSIKRKLPEVEQVARFSGGRSPTLVQVGLKRFKEEAVNFADASLLTMMGYPMIWGNARTALAEPGQIVLTRRLAEKYFGNQYPIGRPLVYDKKFMLTVSGVVDDIPTNSVIQFNALVSLSSMPTLGPQHRDMFERAGFLETYLVLRPGSDVALAEKKLVKVNAGLKFLDSSAKDYLEPLPSLHLNSRMASSIRQPLYIFLSIALAILLLAIINYVSLTTARATQRAREVGVRKAVGGLRRELVAQFYTESVLTTTLAFGLSILALQVLFPWANQALDLHMDNRVLKQGSYWGVIIGLWFGCTILAGSYPALLLSGFRPQDVLKGTMSSGRRGAGIRRAFTTVQFTASVGLLICALVLFAQMRFLRAQSLGINRAQVVALTIDPDMVGQFIPFRNAVRQWAGSENVGVTNTRLFTNYVATYFLTDIKTKKQLMVNALSVDGGFFKTLGITWKNPPTGWGKRPVTELLTVYNQTVVQETGMKGTVLPLQDPFSKEGAVRGVVNDFHIRSLHDPISAMMLTVLSDTSRSLVANGGYMLVKLNPYTDVTQALDQLKLIYDRQQPTVPFDYYFLDDAYNKLYAKEDRLARLFNGFTGLTLLVACLGLLGLMTFNVETRTKEIGIRKVLGASVSSIIGMLSKDFLILIIIAILIASPIAWWAMNKWLSDFAYKITIQWWMFAVSGLLVVAIALLTVSFQSVKAALMNPVKSLRSE